MITDTQGLICEYFLEYLHRKLKDTVYGVYTNKEFAVPDFPYEALSDLPKGIRLSILYDYGYGYREKGYHNIYIGSPQSLYVMSCHVPFSPLDYTMTVGLYDTNPKKAFTHTATESFDYDPYSEESMDSACDGIIKWAEIHIKAKGCI